MNKLSTKGATTLSIMALNVTTFSIMTLSIKSYSQDNSTRAKMLSSIMLNVAFYLLLC